MLKIIFNYNFTETEIKKKKESRLSFQISQCSRLNDFEAKEGF
jgi:hypothetical protein